MTREHRQKASEVSANTNWFLKRTATFAQAFPEIKDFRIDIECHNWGFGKPRNFIFTPTSPPGEYVDCPNHVCYNGGYHLGQFLRYMVADSRKTEVEDSASCQGYEGSPKGRKNYGPCDYHFKVKASITYREAEGRP
jgi:hypothetical protein